VDELERLHPNVYDDVARADLRHIADELVVRMAELDDDGYVAELMRLTASPGVRDGHNGIFAHSPHRRPLHFYPLRHLHVRHERQPA
jgi:hypothetical protein